MKILDIFPDNINNNVSDYNFIFETTHFVLVNHTNVSMEISI